jgi:hypothetical protein
VPEEHDGRYFLNSHGDLTEISHERYDDVRRADLRDTTSIAVVFCATAVASGLSYQRRRSRG